MSKAFFRIAVLAFFMLATAAAVSASDAWVGKKAPDFKIKDVAGAEYTVDGLKGKVIWLNFWGLRCGPCVRELPALETLYEKYKQKGLLVLGVNADGVDGDFITKSFAERADLKSLTITFPLVPDMEFALIDSYQLMGAPLNVMIDRTGVVQYYHEGYEDGDEAKYEKVVVELLGK